MPNFAHSFLVAVLAYTLLAVAGAAVWKRTRSLATTTMALGFVMALLALIIAVTQQLEIDALLREHPADTFFIVQHNAFPRYALLLGLSLAALGLSWHSVRKTNG